MSQRMVRKAVDRRTSPAESERRIAPRYGPDDVPWIAALKPAVGEAVQLVNISKTGVLFDSRDRLTPGRRTTLLASTTDDHLLRLPVVVVRTHVVAFNQDGRPIYRTALMFETECDWNFVTGQAREAGVSRPTASLSDAAPPASESGSELRLDGPLDGGLSSDRRIELVAISALTENGCMVRTASTLAAGPGQAVSVMVFFSPTYRMTLTGVVVAVDQQSCTVRFSDLSAADRRLLRVELRSYVARRELRGGRTIDRLQTTSTPGEIATCTPTDASRFILEKGSSLLAVEGNLW